MTISLNEVGTEKTVVLGESVIGAEGSTRGTRFNSGVCDEDKWLYSENALANTPSRGCGVDARLETKYRRLTARFISELGKTLRISQISVNTGVRAIENFNIQSSLRI
jgi:hypothetical protein